MRPSKATTENVEKTNLKAAEIVQEFLSRSVLNVRADEVDLTEEQFVDLGAMLYASLLLSEMFGLNTDVVLEEAKTKIVNLTKLLEEAEKTVDKE